MEKSNKSTVNRLQRIIPNPRIKFENSNVGDFDYRMLMKNKDIEIDTQSEIIKLYDELDLKKYFMIEVTDEKYNNLKTTYGTIIEELLSINDDIYEIADILIKYLYEYKDSSHKTTLWECFGNIIVENLKQNITQPLDDGWIMCEVCGRRVGQTVNNKKYCDGCYKEKQKQWQRESMRKMRKSVK